MSAPAYYYLNGDFVPPDQACISPLDRAFLLGDGVYEVIPVYGGRMFLLEEHLQRLSRSLREIRIPDPMPAGAWVEVLDRLLGLNPGADRAVYLQVSRGTAPRAHRFPAEVVPTVFAMVNPIPPQAPGLYERGVAVITRPDLRWGRCDIKAVTLLANVLAQQEAVEAGAVEALLLRDGYLTEGSASNVFIVHSGAVRTPPLDRSILPGVTRGLVLDLLRDGVQEIFEAPVSEADLHTADEIWLTSSTREVVPVTRLDGRPVGSGSPGPVWRDTIRRYGLVKQEFVRGAASSGRVPLHG